MGSLVHYTAALVVALLLGAGIVSCGDDEFVEASEPAAPGFFYERYGTEPAQHAVLRLPKGDGPHPVVVLIHGGFWKSRFGRELMNPLALDLIDRGYATWNIEYRRVGEDGGGWPGTFDDVATAIDHLPTLEPRSELDLTDVTVIGHSAGGHLALWAGSRHLLDGASPGASPIVVPTRVIGQAPVTDLGAAARAGLGGGAVEALLGGEPEEVPDRYAIAQPRFDGSVSALAVVSDRDHIVPPEFSSGVDNEFLEVIRVDRGSHFDLIDPSHTSWDIVVQHLGSDDT